MTGALLVGVVVAAVGGVAALLVAAAAARDRRRRNQVVPGVRSGAPSSWAGAHSPEARLHRRLRDAVQAARAAVSDPASRAGAARMAVEAEAVAVDERLVAVASVTGPERDELVTRVAEQVRGVEKAAAALVEARLHGDPTAEVEAELQRVRLLAEARAEVEELDAGPTTLDTPAPDPGPDSTPGAEDEGGARPGRA